MILQHETVRLSTLMNTGRKQQTLNLGLNHYC